MNRISTLKLLGLIVISLFSLEGIAQLYPFTTHTFTPSGATGKNGPTLAMCQAAYSSESWSSDPSYFDMTTQGVQEWTVPQTGDYLIETYGAQGGDDTYAGGEAGGLGAKMVGEFNLTEGQILHIVVGQEGGNALAVDNAAPGGGGGSFVWDPTDTSNPLIAAGGGGGANGTAYANRNATDALNGLDSETHSNGGIGGNGGRNNAGGLSYWAGGGAGWLTNGTGGNNGTDYVYTPGSNGAEGGRTPLNGGIGGTRYSDGTDEGGDGGFGGGGGGGSDNMGAGGGGGYSGGGGSNGDLNPDGAGGGGGSYNAGANQDNAAAFNSGDGYVVITLLCEPLVTTVSSDTVCDGEEVILHAESTGSGTISWSGGITDSVAFTPSVGTTTYTATSTDADDCGFSVDIFVGEYPTVDAGTDTSICEGDSVMLAGTGTANVWNWSDGVVDGDWFTPPSGTTTYTVTGEIDSTGCSAVDSVDVTYNVIDPTVSVSGIELTANQTGATYQWIDCSDSSNVTGETSQSFTPQQDGDYAVIIDLNGCIDTSACETVFGVGIDEVGNDTKWVIYPNPANDHVIVAGSGTFNYALKDAIGRTILTGNATDQTELFVGDLESGMYLISVSQNGQVNTSRLIIK